MNKLQVHDNNVFFIVIIFAVLVRWIFFTGFFGSDETTYTNQALAIVHGEWPISYYLGSTRYGINIPVAFFMALLGPSEFSANIWSFVCSIGEIIVIYLFARQAWGERAAWLAALLLAFLPLHVHYAGRLMADAPLAFFITLSFYLFWLAEQKQQHGLWYILAGVCAGFVFWIKESVFPVFVLMFALYVIYSWRWNWRWVSFAAAIAATLLANCVLMAWITGDPLHIFHVVQHNMENPKLSPSRGRNPNYYFKYLFIDLRHTWLLGYLALGGLIIALKNRSNLARTLNPTSYAIFWAIGLLLIFSFFFIPGKSIRFIPKQTNYMLIFVAPLALWGGYFLSKIPAKPFWSFIIIYVLGGTLLSAMEQQSIHTFTANSKEAIKYAQKNPEKDLYAPANSVRAASYMALFSKDGKVIENIKDYDQLDTNYLSCDERHSATESESKKYIIVDMETMGWANKETIDPSSIPPCWRKIAQLSPPPPTTRKIMSTAIYNIASALPLAAKNYVINKFNDIFEPRPAFVYETPSGA